MAVLICVGALLPGCGEAAGPAKSSGPSSRLAVRLDGTTFDPVGTVLSVVRCGPVVYLATQESKIRPVDIVRQRPLPVLDVDVLPMALAADCNRRLLYAVSPVRRGAARTIVAAIDANTGTIVQQHDVPHMLMRNAEFVPPSTLYVAGVIHGDPAALFRRTAATDFFRNTHLGVRLTLDTGVVEPMLEPYDNECIGAGACLDVSMVPSGSGWLASQPTSTRIAVYERAGARPQLVDITTAGFVRSGTTLAPDADAETRVRWHASNSTIDRVFRFPHHIAVVHVRPRLESGWIFGQQLNFVALMNVYTLSGELVKSDIPLPDLAVGQDDEGVFVVDYGERGRAGDKMNVTLVRIAVP